MDGVAKHTAGMSRVKHIRAMSHEPANLRFLNKIKPFIMFASVIFIFRTVAAGLIRATKICQPEKKCQRKVLNAEKRAYRVCRQLMPAPALPCREAQLLAFNLTVHRKVKALQIAEHGTDAAEEGGAEDKTGRWGDEYEGGEENEDARFYKIGKQPLSA